MKKIIVESSELSEEITNNVSFKLTSHFMYGLYEFNPERMIDDLCHDYNLNIQGINPPYTHLVDDQGKNLILKIVSDG